MGLRDKELFERVYDVLVETAGAPTSKDARWHFVETHVDWARKDPWKTQEYRFMGNLGMGGKFWMDCETFRVSCYSEDSTAERRAAIARANEALRALFVPPETVESTG